MAFSLQLRTGVLATSTTANNVAGTPLDFFTGPAVLTILGNTESAAGTVSHNLQVVTNNVPTTPIPQSNLRVGSTPGNIKIDEDMIISQYPIPAGSRVIHAITNTAATTSNVNFLYLVA